MTEPNEGPVNEARPDMTGAIEITPDMQNIGQVLQKNSVLQAIDDILKTHLPGQPEIQMGVLSVAQALAFDRVRVKNNLQGPRRKFILKKALEDIEKKIRKFGFGNEEPAANENNAT